MEPDVNPDSPHVDEGHENTPEWPPLAPTERRILGVLVEKQKTSRTADAYPLTLNALVTGCNQKSNRDPVTDLDEIEVEEGLTALQHRGLIERVTGGRAERYRHKLYEHWTRIGPELAVLAELLLRGAQTRGDLRSRAGRMDAIDTLDDLDAILRSLASRRLVIFLGDPDRRGALVAHGFLTQDELSGARSHAPTPAALAAPAPLFRSPPPTAPAEPAAAKLDAALAEIDDLKARMSDLEAIVAGIKQQLG